ncbi:hypothetical protein MOZ60_10020 [Stecheria sp. CLA-KB-P133]|uniref:Uncharacterized protein n=1 Tax=Grylomicrobium aquisgranensis TaxID=2926318 RepID=A0AB35U9K8_9FIRM|nr:hypothetical protein [Lactimicrobium massiliense]MDD6458655.1 hypothetical protein [Lactimicrobium massiliense]MDX8420420.1 hypothetical protein [Stecheria sp. CLA-KB-P133]
MKNHITIGDAIIESVHIAKKGAPIIESFREAFRIRKLVNMWFAHEIPIDRLLDIVDGI